jgi:hypothetical protein
MRVPMSGIAFDLSFAATTRIAPPDPKLLQLPLQPISLLANTGQLHLVLDIWQYRQLSLPQIQLRNLSHQPIEITLISQFRPHFSTKNVVNPQIA